MDSADSIPDASPTRGRGWAWAAVVAAGLVWAAQLPTWGFSLVFTPVTSALTAVAWWRSAHDWVFWLGLAVNALLLLTLASYGIGILTGDVAIGFE